MPRGSDIPALADFNQRVVLDCVRRSSAGISRVEIAEITGLSEQSISTMTRRLLEQQLVTEVGREVRGPGKPRTLLGLNADGRYALGVHIDPLSAQVLLVNFAGEVVARTSFRPHDDTTPGELVAELADRGRALLIERGVPDERVAGMGVAVPGPLDAASGVMLNPPLLERWGEVPIARLIAEATGQRVCVEKDLIAAAAGEAWLRQDTATTDFLYVYLGAGLGYGLVRGGVVQQGVSHNFGEVGVFLIPTDQPVLQCCVIPGSFGHRISSRHLCFAGAHLGALDEGEVWAANDSAVRRDALLATMAHRAGAGHQPSRKVFDVLAGDLVSGLAPLTDLLDVDEVVVGGHAWSHYGHLVSEALARGLAEKTVLRRARPVNLQESRATHEAIAIGAATIVLDSVPSPSVSGLVGRGRAPSLEAVV